MSSRRRRRSAARGRGAAGRRAGAKAAGGEAARVGQDRRTGRTQRDEARRRARQQRQLRRAALWGLAIAGVVAIIVASGLWLWRETADAIESQPGNRSVPDLGNLHIPRGDPLIPHSYNSTPPTSGPHYPYLARWGAYIRSRCPMSFRFTTWRMAAW